MDSSSSQLFDSVAVPESLLFEGKKVFISMAWYKTADPRTAFSVMALIDRKKNVAALDFGDAFLIHARNKLADNFLKSNCEWQLCVDDDMVLPWGSASLFRSFTGFSISDKFASMNAIDRLTSHGKTLVGGLYFGRWATGNKPVYSEGSESKTEEEFCRRGPHDLCKPCRWVGTGAMMIHRSVYLDIEKKYPSLARNSSGVSGQWFTPSESDLRNSVEEALKMENADDIKALLKNGLNMSKRVSGLGTGEDVTFCARAKAAGHPCFVDLGLLCGHVGSYCYGPKRVLAV